jgi:uncharacterized protein (DUF488 family)
MTHNIYTIGHSTQPVERFVSLLLRHGITAVADVRSAPYSRHNPQFNREELRTVLKEKGIKYVFLGKELGARSDDDCCYVDEKVQYSLLAKTPLFQSGIGRIIDGAESHKIALMCAEKDPLDCHRTILVARELVNIGCRLIHILVDGSLESHSEAISRLIERFGISKDDMFRSYDIAISEAYEKQADLIAYDRKTKPVA